MISVERSIERVVERKRIQVEFFFLPCSDLIQGHFAVLGRGWPLM